MRADTNNATVLKHILNIITPFSDTYHVVTSFVQENVIEIRKIHLYNIWAFPQNVQQQTAKVKM